MDLRNGVLLLALGVLAATPARAGDKQDFEACDGRVQPGKQADGMGDSAGVARFASMMPGRAGTIEACTRALASSRLLPGQTLRRAHLLRARAAARLQAGDAVEATKDLDLAEAALGGAALDPFVDRSMGVSLKLLRALARAGADDFAGAVPLARAAAAARPWALEVQQLAATVLHAARPFGDASASPWSAVSRLDPGAAATALVKEAEVGNFAGVVALRPGIATAWPTAPVPAVALAMRDPAALGLVPATFVTIHTAYARAALGDVAGARRDLADVRARLAVARPAGFDTQSVAIPSARGLLAGLERYVEARGRQIEARIAVAEKRPSDAIAALIATPMPRDSATVELLGALRAAVPAKDVGLIPDLAPFQKESAEDRRQMLIAAIPAALIAPETPRAVVDYSRARPISWGR